VNNDVLELREEKARRKGKMPGKIPLHLRISMAFDQAREDQRFCSEWNKLYRINDNLPLEKALHLSFHRLCTVLT